MEGHNTTIVICHLTAEIYYRKATQKWHDSADAAEASESRGEKRQQVALQCTIRTRIVLLRNRQIHNYSAL